MSAGAAAAPPSSPLPVAQLVTLRPDLLRQSAHQLTRSLEISSGDLTENARRAGDDPHGTHPTTRSCARPALRARTIARYAPCSVFIVQRL